MGKQKRRNIKIEGCTGQSQKCNLLAEDVFTDVSVEYDDYMWNCEYSTIDIDDLDRCIQRLSEELYEVNQRIEEVEQFKRAKIDHAGRYLKQTSRYKSMKSRIMGACKRGIQKTPDASSKRNYNKKLAQLVNEFYHDCDISIMSLDGAEYITENGNRYYIYHLLHKLEYVYNIFVANFLEHKISFTKFCNLRPFWILTLPNDSVDKFNYFNMLAMMPQPQYYW